MYVTAGHYHPFYQDEDMSEITLYLIRRVFKKEVYYLREYCIKSNKAEWTPNFMHAHHFLEEKKAKKFIQKHLPTRDCDIYTHEAMWVL